MYTKVQCRAQTLDAISATGTAKAFPTNAADEESLRVRVLKNTGRITHA
jgi:hypothetical protein